MTPYTVVKTLPKIVKLKPAELNCRQPADKKTDLKRFDPRALVQMGHKSKRNKTDYVCHPQFPVVNNERKTNLLAQTPQAQNI